MKKIITAILIFFALTATAQKTISSTSYADSLFQNVIKLMQPVRDSVKFQNVVITQQSVIITSQSKTIDSIRNVIAWGISFPSPFVNIVDSLKKTVIVTLPIK